MPNFITRRIAKASRKKLLDRMPEEMKIKAKDHNVIPFMVPGMVGALSVFQNELREQGIGFEAFVYKAQAGMLEREVHFICIPDSRLSKEQLDEILKKLKLI